MPSIATIIRVATVIRLSAALVMMGFSGTSATAEIEKFLRPCEGKMCAFSRFDRDSGRLGRGQGSDRLFHFAVSAAGPAYLAILGKY